MSRSHPPAPATGTTSEQTDSRAVGNGDNIAAARQADYVAFLHRHPFATDAYDLGFLPGIREDYSLQIDDFANVETPVLMVDNDFHDPDIDRYVACIRELPEQPWVCVLGDATTPEQAYEYTRLARSLVNEFPTTEFVIVPKCPEAFEIIDEQFVLGYPMGYSDIQATDISTMSDWRGRRIHLLGASPPKQFEVIEQLTQPTITGDPPADIVDLDWNGPQRVAYLGEYWSREGWQSADHLSIRATVRKSLHEMRKFWQERGVWPTDTPIESVGAAVHEPDDPVFTATGESIREYEMLEDAIIVEYGNGQTLAYQSETERAYVEYHSETLTT
ncbi:DUF6610 family protein [Halococcus salifodinae]|uniref:Uncharacterized protein n=1 Tax=Halococcus salifodinae DSM 8989 TaxID=1227456 RepID=M0NA84_9EURY|nr:DUF6610 family protein [Halococcus salifodinae]EMA54887.1 hypothetical protein C450_04398 [Halococcus salifodinae DSM 8989]